MKPALLALATAAACAGSPALPRARFANAPPATAVDDRRDVPHQPGSRKLLLDLYHFDAIVTEAVVIDAPLEGVAAMDPAYEIDNLELVLGVALW